MTGGPLACAKCLAVLPAAPLAARDVTTCPVCQSQWAVEIFPALFRPHVTGTTAERLLIEGEASCFYHPESKAVTPCGQCGRFLCALCDIDLNGERLCPSCLEAGRAKGRLADLDSQRTLWDSAALMLAALPVLMWPVTLFTAPAAIGCAVLAWRRPRSLVPRSRLWAVLAILIAGGQLIGWGTLAWVLARRHFGL